MVNFSNTVPMLLAVKNYRISCPVCLSGMSHYQNWGGCQETRVFLFWAHLTSMKKFSLDLRYQYPPTSCQQFTLNIPSKLQMHDWCWLIQGRFFPRSIFFLLSGQLPFLLPQSRPVLTMDGPATWIRWKWRQFLDFVYVCLLNYLPDESVPWFNCPHGCLRAYTRT